MDDEHARLAGYRETVTAAVRAGAREDDPALTAALVRDPEPMIGKTAVVELVDQVAGGIASAAEFRRWAARILPEADRLAGEQGRFVRQRVRDWEAWLDAAEGRVLSVAELAGLSYSMQRRMAEFAGSAPVLRLLAEHGQAKKIRNIAANRLRSTEFTGPGRP